jgi:O-antigen/teichoic acid export membrane protein
VFDRLSYNMPVYVLGVVATPAAVGVYETADRIADFGATVAWRLSSPLLTVVSGDAAAGDDRLAYLDAAVTGGTGVTVAVLGYLLAAHDVVAAVAFPGARAAFSATVLVVGGVNVLRGFWTLATHAVEGLGHPGLSFRTKLYGLVAGVPVTATFGAEFGAVAGAAGYAAMNLVVFAAVAAVVRRLLGRVPVAPGVVAHLALGLVVSFAAASAAVAGLGRLVSPAVVAAVAAVACLAAFAAALAAVSAPFRRGAARAVALCRGRVAALAG